MSLRRTRKRTARRRLARWAFVGALLCGGAVAQEGEPTDEPPIAAHPSEIRVIPMRPYVPASPVTIDLEHGARLLVLESRELPLVDGLLVFRAGSAWDPADKVGLAQLLADTLRSGGSTTTPGAQLDDRLDRIGARLTIEAQPTELRFTFQCPGADLPELMGLLHEIIGEPAYPEGVLANARTRLASSILRRADDTAAVADQALAHVVYGTDSPFARVPTPAGLEDIGRADLFAAHHAWFGPDRLVAGLSGAVDVETATLGLEEMLADIPAVGPPAELPAASFLQPSRTQVLIVDHPGVTQTELRITSPGVRRRNQDAAALELWSWVVGVGGMTNRMMMRVRTELGLAYHTGAVYRAGWSRPGAFHAVCATRHDASDQALEAMLAVLAGGLEPIPVEELDAARARLLNAQVFETDTTREVLSRAVELVVHDYPPEFLLEHAEQLRRLGPEEIHAAIGRHLDLDRLTVLAVGPAEKISGPLSRFGEVTLVDDHGRAVAPPRAESALEPLFRAVGGRARWSGLSWLEWEETLVIDPPDAARMEIPLHHWRSANGQELRVEQTVGGESLASVLTPDGAWRESSEGVVDLSERERVALRFDADRSLYRVLHALAIGALDADVAADGTVVVRDGTDTELCRMQLSPDGLPMRITYQHDGAVVTRAFHDWVVEESGWTYPTRVVREPQGVVRQITRFTPLEEVEQNRFQRP